MTIKLSDRHRIVFENLIPNKDVWDFCCDHGYLGTAAYKSQNFPNIYFVDQVASIIEKLQSLFQKYIYFENSNTKAHFICQSGQNLQTPATGTVCITGVGGLTIFTILEGLSKNNILNADRLILGPHRDDQKLAELIQEHLKSFQLQCEIEVVEKNRTRKIFVYDRTKNFPLFSKGIPV